MQKAVMALFVTLGLLVACGESMPLPLSAVALQSGEDPDGDGRVIHWSITGASCDYDAASTNPADDSVHLTVDIDVDGEWEFYGGDNVMRGPVTPGKQDLPGFSVSRQSSGQLFRIRAVFYDAAGQVTDTETAVIAVP